MHRLRFPHPLTLLTACILVAAALSWLVPAGSYDRQVDEATGRTVVVADSYAPVEPDPVGPFEAFVAIPRGMTDAADIIFLVFLIGGAFVVVERTGTFGRGVNTLARRLGHRETLVVAISCVLFCTGGVLYNMHEEIVALIPVLLLLCRRLGYDAVTAVAMSLGAAVVGSAFSPVNPFAVVLAQRLAGLPLSSGWAFRGVVLLVALAFWTGMTIRHAHRTQGARVAAPEPEAGDGGDGGDGRDGGHDGLTPRDVAILGLVVASFAIMVWGNLALAWDFPQMSALFFAMGILAGLVGRLGVSGTARAFVEGFREMAFAAVLIGFARAVFVVLQDGRIVDTLVYGLFTPLESLPPWLSALGMTVGQALVHVPVSSNSGQAVLTLPILVPLSDLLGIARQVTVLAYQYGGALTDMVTPTNGGLMAILAVAGVGYGEWMAFAGRAFAGLLGIGMVAVLLGMWVGVT